MIDRPPCWKVGLWTLAFLFFSNQVWGAGPGHRPRFENLVPNADFEKFLPPQKFPHGWAGSSQGAASSVEALSPGFRSSHSVSIKGSGQFSAAIKEVTPDAYYLLSFWVKREGFEDGEYPHIKIFDTDIYQNELFAYGAWVPVSYILNSAHHEETQLVIYGKDLSHRIEFDHFSLRKMAIHPSSPNHGELIDGPVNFQWVLPDDPRVFRIIIEVSGREDFSDAKTYETYSPAGRNFALPNSLQAGKWFWKVSLWRNGLRLAQSEVSTFAVSSRAGTAGSVEPSSITLTSAQRVPEDFFPIGIYGAPIEAFAELRQAGFNLAQSSDPNLDFIERYVATADLYGLKALTSIFSAKRRGKLSALLNKLKYNRALYGWYIADEPEGRSISPSRLWRLSRRIHADDPFHPTVLVNIRSNKTIDYAPAADIVMVDPYPVPHRPMTWLSDSIDEAIRTVSGRKPVWAVIQAFSWAEGDPDFAEGRFPTYDEERCMAWLSIVHGVKGILFFSHRSARHNDPGLKHWSGVKRVAGELQKMHPLLLAPNQVEKPGLQAAFASSAENTLKGQTALDANGDPAIHYAVKKIASNEVESGEDWVRAGQYLIAVNVTGNPVSAAFSIPGDAGRAADVFFENRAIPITQNRLKDRFKPYAVHIYKLK